MLSDYLKVVNTCVANISRIFLLLDISLYCGHKPQQIICNLCLQKMFITDPVGFIACENMYVIMIYNNSINKNSKLDCKNNFCINAAFQIDCHCIQS